MGASVTNAVVLALGLAGQGDFVAGMTAATGSVQDLADAVSAANARMATASGATAKASADASTEIIAANERTLGSVDALAADTTAASAEVSTAYAKMGASAGSAAAATGAAAGATSGSLLGMVTSMKTLALGAATYAGVSAFSKFQQNLTLLTTQAGLASGQLGAVEQAIKRVSAATGTSWTNVAAAIYSPISEGFGVKGAAVVEQYAAELAKIGGSPLAGNEGTTYALSTMLRAYGEKPTQSNTAAMAALINAGVSAGDMHLSDLLAAQSTGISARPGRTGSARRTPWASWTSSPARAYRLTPRPPVRACSWP